MSSIVGTSLSGRYRLDAQIGTGGMSTVYRAFDTTLERAVAVKLMHREMSSDSAQLERFRREARAVALFSHPHIVAVIDAGDDDGRPYIVFEYVEGETLKDRIRRAGQLPIDESLAYAIEITRALSAAHRHGIVHRDIKPQNVLIDEEGQAKVTDFGIARTLEDDGLTADGRVLGTTDYVSPEQALGHDVNGQSDVYSLGIVLFEMLTGRVPFSGESQVAVAMKHVREDLPDVQRLRPEVSASVAAVLDRMTAKQLERRTTDADTLEDELEDVLAIEAARAGHSTGEATAVLRTLPASARRRMPWRMRSAKAPLAAGALVAAVVALVLVVVLGGQVADRVERGTGTAGSAPARGERPVSLARSAATDYDPQGDAAEHRDQTARAVDGDPATTWTTESYRDGVIAGSGGPKGVGLYVDARPGVAATSILVQTQEPGWDAEIYAAPAGAAVPDTLDGWTKVGGGTVAKRRTRFSLETGDTRYRYYLVWITSLPEGERNVGISEISLTQRS